MTHTHVITGSFGAGKITAIRRLMLHKLESELRSQIQSADVLLLSKADRAGPTESRAFAEIVAAWRGLLRDAALDLRP